MADWRQVVVGPARFRGAAFFVEVSELAGGRKIVVHNFPNRDLPFAEDFGLADRLFTIDGYVLGTDYLTDRDALLAALQQPGPGTLIHPYHGTRQVVSLGFGVREQPIEGGMARISMQFIEVAASNLGAPFVAAVPRAVVSASATNVLAESPKTFLTRYRLSTTAPGLPGRSLPAFSFTSIGNLVRTASTTLDKTFRPIIKTAENIARFKRQIDNLVLDSLSLARSPFSLANRFGDLFRSLTTMPSTPRLGVDAMLGAYRFRPDIPRPLAVTATRRIEQVNYDATVAVIRVGMAAVAAQFVADATFDTYEDAIAVRDAVTEVIDEQAAGATDDTYDALVQLRTDIVGAVPNERQNLPRLITITPIVTEPSLVIAHRLYGDVTLESSLVTRNRVRHPGFVLGDRELQVIARA